MEQLIEQMNKALADTFAFYLKAQFFHWNVTGRDFAQHHEFFGNIYGEVYGAVDPLAEHIRAIDGFAAGSFTRFQQLTTITDRITVPSVDQMVIELHSDNMRVLASLTSAMRIAEQYNEYGLVNYLQDRIDQHKKHGWMLKSSIPSGAR